MDSEKQSVDGHAKDAHGRPTTGTHDIQSDNLEFGGHDQLSRGLKSRHIQFLALGGAIGTGLFVGSGQILNLVGPAPLWMVACTSCDN